MIEQTMKSMARSSDVAVALFSRIMTNTDSRMLKPLEEIVTVFISYNKSSFSTASTVRAFTHILHCAVVAGYLLRTHEVEGTVLDKVLKKTGVLPDEDQFKALLSAEIPEDLVNRIRNECKRFTEDHITFDDLVESVTHFS